MAIEVQNNGEEGNRWSNDHRRGNTEPARIRRSGDNGRWDLTVRHESTYSALQKKNMGESPVPQHQELIPREAEP